MLEFDEWLESAIEMFDEDDYVGTITSCSNIINFCSESSLYSQIKSDAFFYRGYSQFLIENYIFAIRDFDQSIKLNSEMSQVDEAATYSLRAEAKEKLLLYHSALSDYSISLKLDPENSEIYFDCAMCKVKMGNLKNALADFKMAILIDPHYSYYEERFKCRKAINDLAGAKRDWDEMNRLRDRGIPKQKISYVQESFFLSNPLLKLDDN